MAGEWDIDVQDGGNRGEFVINADGEFQVGGCCCASEEPCSDCAGAQPPLTVTVTGGSAPEGQYTYVDFVDWGGWCRWRWWKGTECTGGPGGFSVYVAYCVVTGTWCAYSIATGNCNGSYGTFGPDCLCAGYLYMDIDNDVMCVNGVIIGSFDLQGGMHVEMNT